MILACGFQPGAEHLGLRVLRADRSGRFTRRGRDRKSKTACEADACSAGTAGIVAAKAPNWHRRDSGDLVRSYQRTTRAHSSAARAGCVGSWSNRCGHHLSSAFHPWASRVAYAVWCRTRARRGSATGLWHFSHRRRHNRCRIYLEQESELGVIAILVVDTIATVSSFESGPIRRGMLTTFALVRPNESRESK